MDKASGSLLREIRLARQLWPAQISKTLARQLGLMIEKHGLSVLSGDIQLLERKVVCHPFRTVGPRDSTSLLRDSEFIPCIKFCDRALGVLGIQGDCIQIPDVQGFRRLR